MPATRNGRAFPFVPLRVWVSVALSGFYVVTGWRNQRINVLEESEEKNSSERTRHITQTWSHQRLNLRHVPRNL